VAIGEDREELASVPGQVVGQPGAGQRVGDGVGGEARPALLAVGDDRRPGLLLVLDRVPDGLVLFGLQLLTADLAGVVLGVRPLQPARAGQRADGLGGDSGQAS
jgi:hypothetical protein